VKDKFRAVLFDLPILPYKSAFCPCNRSVFSMTKRCEPPGAYELKLPCYHPGPGIHTNPEMWCRKSRNLSIGTCTCQKTKIMRPLHRPVTHKLFVGWWPKDTGPLKELEVREREEPLTSIYINWMFFVVGARIKARAAVSRGILGTIPN
jgi:hypothetical protein